MALAKKKGHDALALAAALAHDEALAHQEGPRKGLTREHVDGLRLAGLTRDEAAELLEEWFGPALASKVAADFGSYGEWAR